MRKKLVHFIIAGIQDKKGKEIVDIHVSDINNSICDHFIICHGDSNVQVNAIANSVEKKVKEQFQEPPVHKEGFGNSCWIILDYHDIVVHIFQREVRKFYAIEELWDDAKKENIENLV